MQEQTSSCWRSENTWRCPHKLHWYLCIMFCQYGSRKRKGWEKMKFEIKQLACMNLLRVENIYMKWNLSTSFRVMARRFSLVAMKATVNSEDNKIWDHMKTKPLCARHTIDISVFSGSRYLGSLKFEIHFNLTCKQLIIVEKTSQPPFKLISILSDQNHDSSMDIADFLMQSLPSALIEKTFLKCITR